ncbi:hypothetical protein EMCRGX_G013935 [Ephydatia muelleri]
MIWSLVKASTHGENCWKLLDVEPSFHGFVVSDYIALFCVNRAHLGVPWRIGEKEKAMEIDRLHEDEVLSSSWIRLTRGIGISLVWLLRLVVSFTGMESCDLDACGYVMT